VLLVGTFDGNRCPDGNSSCYLKGVKNPFHKFIPL
jgi:hypothetical protein